MEPANTQTIKISKIFPGIAEYATIATTKPHVKRPLHIFQAYQAHNYPS